MTDSGFNDSGKRFQLRNNQDISQVKVSNTNRLIARS